MPDDDLNPVAEQLGLVHVCEIVDAEAALGVSIDVHEAAQDITPGHSPTNGIPQVPRRVTSRIQFRGRHASHSFRSDHYRSSVTIVDRGHHRAVFHMDLSGTVPPEHSSNPEDRTRCRLGGRWGAAPVRISYGKFRRS